MMRFRRLSAPGAAALSLWELRGPEQALTALFGALPAPGSFRPVCVGGAAVFDEGLLWRRAAAEVELHLHGGPGTADALRRWLATSDWQEAPSGGASDEAEHGFRAARTARVALAWGAARGGARERRLARIVALPEPERRAEAQALLVAAAWAEALESPPRVVLAGPPNAGKSTLLNTWLQRPRATVSPFAGTTRDAVRALRAVGAGEAAFPVQLVDTAGLWAQAADVDAEAVARSRAEIERAWRTVWVLDAASAPEPEVVAAWRELRRPEDVALLHRVDLGERWSPERELGGRWLRGSAQVDPAGLVTALEDALLAPLGPPPPPATLLPLGAAFRETLRALADGGPARG